MCVYVCTYVYMHAGGAEKGAQERVCGCVCVCGGGGVGRDARALARVERNRAGSLWVLQGRKKAFKHEHLRPYTPRQSYPVTYDSSRTAAFVAPTTSRPLLLLCGSILCATVSCVN
jgi:hypothetical protein